MTKSSLISSKIFLRPICLLLCLLWLPTAATDTTTSECTTTNSETKPPTVRALLQESSREDIIALLGTVYEHSPWVAERFVGADATTASSSVPTTTNNNTITTITDLAAALRHIVDHEASYEQKLTLLQAHPDLRDKVVAVLTADSQDEQASSGLSDLTAEELETFHALNTAYKEKYGFPFILAVRHASKYTILAALRGRMGNPPEVEFVQALKQVHTIAWMRLLQKIDTSDAQGYLTCHVLDTANGIPGTYVRNYADL